MCLSCKDCTERVDSLTARQVKPWCDARLKSILQSKVELLTFYYTLGRTAHLKRNLKVLCNELSKRGYQIKCPLLGL